MQCSLCTNVAHRVVKIRGKDVGFCNSEEHTKAAFAAAKRTIPPIEFSARNPHELTRKQFPKHMTRDYAIHSTL